VLGADPRDGCRRARLMLLNRVWMIGKNAPALAPRPGPPGCVSNARRGRRRGRDSRRTRRSGGASGWRRFRVRGAEFGAARGRQHDDAGVAGNKAVLALHPRACPSGSLVPAPSRRGDDEAFVGALRAASATARIAAAVSSASRKPRSGRAQSLLSPWRSLCAMVQAV
jgi:hypothetical protein